MPLNAFLGPKFTQNALAAWAPYRTPLGELRAKALPQSPCRFQGDSSRQGKGKGGERGRRERGKGVLGKGKRERREGKRERGKGEKGEKEFKGRGGGVCVIDVRGIDAPGPAGPS